MIHGRNTINKRIYNVRFSELALFDAPPGSQFINCDVSCSLSVAVKHLLFRMRFGLDPNSQPIGRNAASVCHFAPLINQNGLAFMTNKLR